MTSVPLATRLNPTPDSLPGIGDMRRRLGFIGMAWIYITFQTCAAAPSPIYVIYQHEWAVPAWILGFAFSAYAFTLLIAIITVGSLSDHLGRLPVLAGALALQIGAMTLLLFAQNIEVVLIARLLQGFATGAAITTLSAALTDLSPSKDRQLGASFASVAPLIGLAVGALGSGLLIHFDPASVPLIFTILDGLLLIGVVFVAVSPDLIAKTPGAIRSLIPRIRIPAAARSAFGASALLNIAVWLASGLSLGLVGQINRQIFFIQDGLASGGTIALQMGVASITVFVFRKMDTRRSGILASIGLAVGALVMALGITDTLFPIYLVGTALTGYGIGLGFAGYIRLLVPTVGAEDRAALFSAMYVVSYLTFGIPIIAAGFLIAAFGATPVILVYVGATFIVSVLAARALRRYGRRRPALQS